MDTLKSLIGSRKRESSTAGGQQRKKWKRRGEVLLEKEKEEEQKRSSNNNNNSKGNGDDEAANRKRAEPGATLETRLDKLLGAAGGDGGDGTDTGDGSRPRYPPRATVISRLRARGHPATLFGETDEDRALRLRRVEVTEPEVVGGSTNEYLQQHLAEAEAEGDGAQIEGKMAEAEARAAKEQDERDALDTTVEGDILNYFKSLLREWAAELDARPAQEKSTARGKAATATMKQTGAYLQPLFDGLRAKSTEADVVEALEKMMRHMKNRDYRSANEIYLTLSIGNEAWPMGVTMVGIHERAARERISQVKKKHAAHVLNDETSRKYIQAVYRLLMFCQRVRPGSASMTFGEFHGKQQTQ